MFDSKLFASKLADITPYTVDTASYEVRLDANESFISMPASMREKFAAETEKLAFNRYPDPNASELCTAFSAYYGIDRENVAAGNGSDEIISVLMNGFVDKGSSVISFSYDFSMYAFYARLAELRSVVCPKNRDLQIDFSKADEYIKNTGAKICIFSNPCNPTGRIEKKSDIAALAAKNPGTIFVVDEAYMDFAGELSESESFLRDNASYTNIVVLKTMSKAIGSAALRLGFIVADKKFCDMFKAVKSPYNVNRVSQAFGKVIMSDRALLDESIKLIREQTELLQSGLAARSIAPFPKMHTNFVFIETPSAKDIYEYLKERGVLIRYFSSYGALRITAGSQSENERLFALLDEYLGK